LALRIAFKAKLGFLTVIPHPSYPELE
jgi:hypothetical protein